MHRSKVAPNNDSGHVKVVVAILVAHNLVQNFLLNERGYTNGNLVISGVLLRVGRASGLGWDEMGINPDDFRRDLRIGAGAVVAGGAMALLALRNPEMRVFLRDERVSAASTTPVWRRALLRFPLGTALFEEVAFRGVLPALLRQNYRPIPADALSATAFGLWHLIPTGRALSGNPLGEGRSGRWRTAAILGGCVAAGGSGLALSWMRRTTGSLLAPWLVHSSFNSLSYLAGVAALSLPDPQNSPREPAHEPTCYRT